MIKVKFFTNVKSYLGLDEIEIEQESISVKELLIGINNRVKNNLLEKLIDDKGGLKRGINILVNGRNILHLDKLNTLVESSDEVALFPSAGGGAPVCRSR